MVSLIGKAAAFAELGKYDEAIECFDKALSIDPNYIMALDNKKTVASKLRLWYL
jgi:tetratricopeptide (TPR) repeat protein